MKGQWIELYDPIPSMIFNLFDPKTLLTVSRVNKEWKDEANKDMHWKKFLTKKDDKLGNCKSLFLIEQKTKLDETFKRISNIELVKFDKSIKSLIFKGYLLATEVKKLTPTQLLNLKNTGIQRLICENVLSIEAAKRLSHFERANLAHRHICVLLLKKLISIDEAKRLSTTELTNLADVDCYTLLESNIVDLNQLKQMTFNQRADLKRTHQSAQKTP